MAFSSGYANNIGYGFEIIPETILDIRICHFSCQQLHGGIVHLGSVETLYFEVIPVNRGYSKVALILHDILRYGIEYFCIDKQIVFYITDG